MANIHDHELDKQIFGHNFEVFPVNDPCTLYIYTLDVFHCMYKTKAAISLLDSILTILYVKSVIAIKLCWQGINASVSL